MEPTELDDLFKRTVEENESSATLSKERQDKLWSKIQSRPANKNLWIWKAASVVLFFVSSALAFALFTDSESNTELISQTMIVPANSVQTIPLDEAVVESNEIKPKPAEMSVQVVRDTVVRYVTKEKIVFVEKEVESDNHLQVDSLLIALEENQQEIEQLRQLLEKPQELNPNSSNLEVAFLNDKPKVSNTKNSESKIKFQLALFNTNIR